MRTHAQLVNDTQPFPDKLISQTPAGQKRPALDYVAWTNYAQRVLLRHGPHRYSVTSMVPTGDKVSVSVRIQFSDDEWYDGAATDTDAEIAESQAYKRACAHGGIGLHLWCKDDDGGYWLPAFFEADTDDERPFTNE